MLATYSEEQFLKFIFVTLNLRRRKVTALFLNRQPHLSRYGNFLSRDRITIRSAVDQLF
jgi:hypothetical protein